MKEETSSVEGLIAADERDKHTGAPDHVACEAACPTRLSIRHGPVRYGDDQRTGTLRRMTDPGSIEAMLTNQVRAKREMLVAALIALATIVVLALLQT